jgi:hypothetical protein
MKQVKPLLLLLMSLFPCSAVIAQSNIGNINSGAYSSNSQVFSVGEIFVVSDGNPDETNSGMPGIVSAIGFFTGIQEQFITSDSRAYPNPVMTVVRFQLPPGSAADRITVYDTFGRSVLDTWITNSSADLSFLPTGIYFIYTNDSAIAPFKIIKQ